MKKIDVRHATTRRFAVLLSGHYRSSGTTVDFGQGTKAEFNCWRDDVHTAVRVAVTAATSKLELSFANKIEG